MLADKDNAEGRGKGSLSSWRLSIPILGTGPMMGTPATTNSKQGDEELDGAWRIGRLEAMGMDSRLERDVKKETIDFITEQ